MLTILGIMINMKLMNSILKLIGSRSNNSFLVLLLELKIIILTMEQNLKL